jgi:hypothetical protein
MPILAAGAPALRASTGFQHPARATPRLHVTAASSKKGFGDGAGKGGKQSVKVRLGSCARLCSVQQVVGWSVGCKRGTTSYKEVPVWPARFTIVEPKRIVLQVSKRGKVASRQDTAQQLKQLQDEQAAYEARLSSLSSQQPAAAVAAADVDDDEDSKYAAMPQQVTDRMLKRILLFSGLPVFGGIMLFPFFYFLKVGPAGGLDLPSASLTGRKLMLLVYASCALLRSHPVPWAAASCSAALLSGQEAYASCVCLLRPSQSARLFRGWQRCAGQERAFGQVQGGRGPRVPGFPMPCRPYLRARDNVCLFLTCTVACRLACMCRSRGLRRPGHLRLCSHGWLARALFCAAQVTKGVDLPTWVVYIASTLSFGGGLFGIT